MVRSGKDAIVELLDNRKAAFDGLIVSNDEMAIGAMKELTGRRIEIPDRVSIMGFDDIQDCEYSIPPLSTVKQPLYQQGRLAMKCAYTIIQGKTPPETMVLPTKIVLRSSCGCMGLSVNKAADETVNLKPEINDILMMADNRVPEKSVIFEITDKIIAISHGAEKPDHDSVVKYISRAITAQLQLGKDVGVWKPIFNVLNAYISFEKSVHRDAVKKIIEESLINIRDLSHSREVATRITVERSVINTRTAVLEITSSLSRAELCRKITESMKIFGIKGCYIFNYDKIHEHRRGNKWKMPEKMVLFLASNEKTNGNFESMPDYTISPYEFIPESLYDTTKNHIFLIAPNYYLLDQYGYIIYDMGIRDGNVYDFISLAISSTLRSVLLLMERKDAEGRLRRVLSELEATNKKLASISETDDLTGLYNRRGFIRFAGQQLALARQIQQDGLLFYLDLDGLKKINDKYGHDAGDIAIKTCAELLKKVFRKMDSIGRIGGDEFVALTINADENTKEIIRQRIKRVFRECNQTRKNSYVLSISIGGTFFKWDEEVPMETLLERADKNLYLMKNKKNAKSP